MFRRSATVGVLLALALWALVALPAAAQGGPFGTAQDRRPVQVVGGDAYPTLADALASARDGDTIEVHGGVYPGPVLVDKRVRLVGTDWPVIDGGGTGTVITVTASGASIEGFLVRNSGNLLEGEDTGIIVKAEDVTVAGNRLENVLFGIYLQRATRAAIRDNRLYGMDLPPARRGDLIRVWYSSDVVVEGNVVEHGRDVVLWYSERLTLRNNTVTDGRYALHFMYCDNALLEGNRLTNNSVGAYLMYSRRLQMRHNVIGENRGTSGYGVGLKEVDDGVIEENLFANNRVGAYVDTSPREQDSTLTMRGNVFTLNDTGLRLMPAIHHNLYQANTFLDNGAQVEVAGGGDLVGNMWSVDGQGNYWSDYAGFDADGNGTGDVPYHAERFFEDLMSRHETLRLFVYSPAAQAVDFAARAFPFIRPQPKLTDDAPLMSARPLPGLRLHEEQPRWPMALAAIGLVTGALVLTLFPSLRRKPRGRPETEPAPLPPAPPSHVGDMVAAKGLRKRFGRATALDGVSFAVRPGQAVALWGANGAGKTTALRCLLGLLPFEGTVRIGGHDVRKQGKRARRLVGFVPQEISFHDDLTVAETLRLYARLRKVNADTGGELLARLGLAEHAGKQVRQLSGGLRQRLGLAVALLDDPPVLVLDEPTTNLDAAARAAFLSLLLELQAAGKTLVFASHRSTEVLQLADRVLLLEQGRLVEDTTPIQLLSRTGNGHVLRLDVGLERVGDALRTLSGHGILARRNHRTVRVPVVPGEKGRAMTLLVQAGIPVRDFDLEDSEEGGAS